MAASADERAKSRALAESLVGKRLLLVAGEDDDGRDYCFTDESVPALICGCWRRRRGWSPGHRRASRSPSLGEALTPATPTPAWRQFARSG